MVGRAKQGKKPYQKNRQGPNMLNFGASKHRIKGAGPPLTSGFTSGCHYE